MTFVVTVSDPDGDALNWTLSFGDGNRTAGTRSANATHLFQRGGNFTATLAVTDGRANATATVRVEVQVDAPPSPPLDPACQRPDALELPGGHYLDDRGQPTGLISEGGTWLYKETNGIAGLQVTQVPGTAPGVGGGVDPIAVEHGCTNGDELVF